MFTIFITAKTAIVFTTVMNYQSGRNTPQGINLIFVTMFGIVKTVTTVTSVLIFTNVTHHCFGNHSLKAAELDW